MFHFGSSKVIWGKCPQKTTRSELSKGGAGNNATFSVKKVHKLEEHMLFVHPKNLQRFPPLARCGKVSRGPPDHHRGAIHQNYLGIHWRGRAIPQLNHRIIGWKRPLRSSSPLSWNYQSPGLCWKLFRAVRFCWLLMHHLASGTYPEPGDQVIFILQHVLY